MQTQEWKIATVSNDEDGEHVLRRRSVAISPVRHSARRPQSHVGRSSGGEDSHLLVPFLVSVFL